MIKNSLFKRILIFFALLALIVLLRYVIIPHFISFEMIKSNRLYLQQFIHSHYAASVLFYLALYLIVVTLSVPLVALLTIFGGYFFGAILGTLYTNIGATMGAVISFLMFRHLIGSSVQEKYKKQLESFNKSMEENGVYYLLSIHFIALIPFFLVNILASFTTVSLWTFIWTTSLGILPVSLVFAYAGEQLSSVESVQDIMSYKLIFAFSLLALLALAPAIIKKMKR